MNRIYALVEEVPFITELQRDFYRIMLSERKANILDYSMKRFLRHEMTQKEWQDAPQQTHEVTM